ncbi:MAG: hypothetical protein M3P04_10560 [Actinomycetota bacterium]|nr:hypothetical protein [Actinomycetota bacterium]
MTTDAASGSDEPMSAGTHQTPPSKTAAVSASHGPVGAQRRERPKSILALIEYAYAESGRKLTLARKDLRELVVDGEEAQAEIEAVRRLSAQDPLLAVPPSLLATLAELGAEVSVRRRLLELVLVAFADHRLFEGRMERLADAEMQPILTAREVSEAARRVNFDAQAALALSELTEAGRERLRVNAVTAFELFRVLRDGWNSSQFVEDMCALVWDAPHQSSAYKTAALLATARNGDALGQLARHFEGRVRDLERELTHMVAFSASQQQRAVAAEGASESIRTELDGERSRSHDLQSRIDDLQGRLLNEQSSRVVDKSHHVDDYETLRTQVIRRLTAQSELLADGLHALRNGSSPVAEEFVDRALTAIKSEVARLKNRDGEDQ